MENNCTFVFLTWEDISYSRTGVVFSGMKQSQRRTHLEKIELNSILQMAIQIRRYAKASSIDSPIYVIGSPCGLLVISLRIAIPNARVVFDTGWPQVDALMTKNNRNLGAILRYSKMYLLDFVSIKLSNQVAVESKTQLARIQRKFLVKVGKLFVSYTGFNEQNVSVAGNPYVRKEASQTILFRGKVNNEAGIDLIAEVSWLLPNHLKLVVISSNLPSRIVFAPGTEIISSRLTEQKLAEYYSRATLAIGQLGESNRTSFTLPHKFFEAAFFGVPYLTPRTEGLSELISATEYELFCENSSARDIAKKISDFAKDVKKQEIVSNYLSKAYAESFSQDIISRNFIRSTTAFFKVKNKSR